MGERREEAKQRFCDDLLDVLRSATDYEVPLEDDGGAVTAALDRLEAVIAQREEIAFQAGQSVAH